MNVAMGQEALSRWRFIDSFKLDWPPRNSSPRCRALGDVHRRLQGREHAPACAVLVQVAWRARCVVAPHHRGQRSIARKLTEPDAHSLRQLDMHSLRGARTGVQ